MKKLIIILATMFDPEYICSGLFLELRCDNVGIVGKAIIHDKSFPCNSGILSCNQNRSR